MKTIQAFTNHRTTQEMKDFDSLIILPVCKDMWTRKRHRNFNNVLRGAGNSAAKFLEKTTEFMSIPCIFNWFLQIHFRNVVGVDKFG